MQTGGSDQGGNITAGAGLVHRIEQRGVHVLATPLITKADGTKFGTLIGRPVVLLADRPTIVALLVVSGLANRAQHAARSVKAVNNAKVRDEGWTLTEPDLLPGGWLVLRRGRRLTAGVRGR